MIFFVHLDSNRKSEQFWFDFKKIFINQEPGDFITKVKQVNSQSDLISMSSFAGPFYLTVRSSVCIILIWDPCICNLYDPCQTGSILHTSETSPMCTLISLNK